MPDVLVPDTSSILPIAAHTARGNSYNMAQSTCRLNAFARLFEHRAIRLQRRKAECETFQ